MSNARIVVLNQSNFDNSVARGTILVDFWAPWCGPCRMQLGILDQLAASDRFPANAAIAKVNVDENPELAAKFEIMTVPTMLVYKDGKMVKRMSGVHSVDQLLQAMQ